MFKPSNKKKLGVSLAALMVAQGLVLPLSAYAGEVGSSSSGVAVPISAPAVVPASEQKAKVALAEAINAIKNNFTIPADFTNFSSGFNSGSDGQTWNLYWSSKTKGSANAQVNAMTGEVVQFNLWQESSATGLQVPKLSKAQAQEKAAALIKKLLPEKWNDLSLVEGQNKAVQPSTYGNLSYQFKWERKVNGVPVLGDGVTVQVDADQGSILSYNFVWNEGTFPDSGKAISSEGAKQAFSKAGLLKLKYFQASRYYILKAEDNNPNIQLVYGLTSSNYGLNGAIDALTGENLKLNDGSYVFYGQSSQGGKDAADAGTGPTLTPEEQLEVDANDKLLTKEQAAEKVTQLTDSTTGLELTGSNLYYNSATGVRSWHLQWSKYTDGEKIRSDYDYVSASVNAATGELLNFYVSNPVNNEGKDKISAEAAQKIGSDFLQKVQPNRFSQSELDKSQLASELDSMPTSYQSYTFNYQRLVSNVPFANNTISVSVDAYTGKISSYNLNWNDNLVFPAPVGLIGDQQAVDKFLAARPMTLNYIKVMNRDGKMEMHLVYIPKLDALTMSGSELVDAKSGAMLNYDGKVMSQVPQAVEFTDVAGLANEQEIRFLGSAGIFTEYGTTFRPEEKVSLISLFRAMYQINNGYGEQLSDDELMTRIKDYGWLKEDLAQDSEVNRELAAKIVIRMLGYDKIASLKDIYQIPYQDSAKVSADAKGYVALAWALGILKVDGANFEPQHALTRAEAVNLLFKAYNTEK